MIVIAMGDATLRWHRIFAAVAFYAAWPLGYVFAAMADVRGQLLCAFLGASAAAMWCVVDSLALGRYWPRSLHWVTFWVWPLGVPGYLVWSRGRRGLILAFVALVGVIAAALAGQLVVFLMATL